MLRRLLVLLAFLALPALAQAQDFIRYTPGNTFAAPIFLSDGLVGAPALAWTSDPDTGFYWSSSGLFNIGVNGTIRYTLSSGALKTYAVGFQSCSSAGTLCSTYADTGISGGKTKTLTDAAAAVSFVRIAVPTNGYIGGRLIFTANSTDGTDRLTTTGQYYFAGADTAGTVTCGAPSAVGTPATAYRRVNTLVCTVTAATSTTNCDLQVTCTDNLAGDQTPTFEWRLDMPATATVTPQ